MREVRDDDPAGRQVDGDGDDRQDEGQLGQGGDGEAGAVGQGPVELGEDGRGDGAEGLVDVGRQMCSEAPPTSTTAMVSPERPAEAEHGGADDARAHPGQR